MQSIQIKYLPATNTKGARLKATCEGGSIVEPCDYSFYLLKDNDADCGNYRNKQALNLAFKLANQKLDWKVKTFCKGYFNGCDYFNIVEFVK